MRLHRFIGDFDCEQEQITIGDEGVINQIVNVLRLGVGDRLILSDGEGQECVGEITERQKNTLVVRVTEHHRNTNDPRVHTVLYCAILKRENFELVAQKATEIGIAEIVPLITARTVKLDIKEDRLAKIVSEAAEQSGRARVPVLHAPMQFMDAIADAQRNDANFFFALSDEALPLELPHHHQRRGLFIGPEGGWTDEEELVARQHGCAIVSLGALTLRGETAAIVASYLGTRD